MLRIALIGTLLLGLVSMGCTTDPAYKAEVEKWRADHETDLKKDDGWLTVAGLYWLKDGVNTVGKGDAYDVALTQNFSGSKFGEIDFHNGKATLTVATGVEASVDGKPASTVELASDDPGPATKITTGSQTFYLIKREDRFGIRLKDSRSPARMNFTGEHWFPVDANYRVVGTFEPFGSEQEIEIPNILGGTFKMKSPGIVRFRLNGKDVSLQPVVEDDKQLFFIFKDATAGEETYGAGRFLYTDDPVDGKVTLDFNKAENPPCAFTEFATCPLPPAQNKLDLAIKAGERKYSH